LFQLLGENSDKSRVGSGLLKVILTEIQMMNIRKIPNLKMTNDKAQMSNQAQNPNDKTH